ncbi:myb/SANT-like DNA-binding domain-containing protein 3 [Hyposmocoma kahamanoa]|uniref:myb/SANT-like DNA-binding domain-containing protein 3 n=1 Tax=Hyposmocoma kahamanoa TaxID=1477025 RepID=UPI000E6D9F6F|nr:myb/SANT-like DNA-binding domain-containing protein 3 [Hyposmocoma kahamanoa]
MSSRKSAFTSFAKEYLKEILIPHINVLESKRTDADFIKKKAELWGKVADTFNSSPQVQHATSQQLKKLWLNMKARARDAKSLEKQRSHTGGGPFVPDVDPDHESVLSMVPHLMPSINIEKDSDGPGESVAGDDDSFAWKPKKMRRTSPDCIEDYFLEDINEVIVSSMPEDH